MKKTHRRVHRLAWLLLLPVLLLIVVHAQQGRFDIEDRYQTSPIPEPGAKL